MSCISGTFVKDVSANGARAKNTRDCDLQAENKKLNPLTSPLSLCESKVAVSCHYRVEFHWNYLIAV